MRRGVWDVYLEELREYLKNGKTAKYREVFISLRHYCPLKMDGVKN